MKSWQLKFRLYRRLYLFFNNIGLWFYDKTWKILNKNDKVKGGL